jgi:hypothetical protein
VGFLVGTGGIFVSSVGEGVSSSHVQYGDGAFDVVGMFDVVGEYVGESSSTSSEQGTGVGNSVGKGVNKAGGVWGDDVVGIMVLSPQWQVGLGDGTDVGFLVQGVGLLVGFLVFGGIGSSG